MINLHPTSLEALSLLGFSSQITQEKLERGGRDPRSGLRRKAPIASGGRRLAGLCGRVWTLGL
ncbi:hypothetical protein CR513_00622, partial [Mucuna pruriens]